jgi:hypothetical protein
MWRMIQIVAAGTQLKQMLSLCIEQKICRSSRRMPSKKSSSRCWQPLCVMCRAFSTAVNEQRYALGHYSPPCQERPGHECHFYPRALMPSSLASVERVALFHYCTRSLEDFRIKSARAGGNNPKGKPLSFFQAMEQCASSPAPQLPCEQPVVNVAVQTTTDTWESHRCPSLPLPSRCRRTGYSQPAAFLYLYFGGFRELCA